MKARGRRGRSWLSPRFANLYLSVPFYPTVDQLRSLPLIAPLAILDALNAACNVRCSLKWPNDVLVADKKIAGVLLESELRGDNPQFAIVGLGINVNFDPGDYPEIAALATSALHEAGVLQNRGRTTRVLPCLPRALVCVARRTDAEPLEITPLDLGRRVRSRSKAANWTAWPMTWPMTEV